MISVAKPARNVALFPAGKRIGWLWACLKELEDVPHNYRFEWGEGGDITLSHRAHVLGLWRETSGFLSYTPLAQRAPSFVTDHVAEAVRYTRLIVAIGRAPELRSADRSS